jgi:hypothetical protein
MKRFKELILMGIFLFISYQVMSQDFEEKPIFEIGYDPGLAINGAYNNNDTPVLHFHFAGGLQFESGNQFLIETTYANLEPASYYSIGLQFNKYINYNPIKETKLRVFGVTLFDASKLDYYIGGGPMIIQRGYNSNEKKIFVTGKLNGKIAYNIGKVTSFYVNLDYLYRPERDIKKFKSQVDIGLQITI